MKFTKKLSKYTITEKLNNFFQNIPFTENIDFTSLFDTCIEYNYNFEDLHDIFFSQNLNNYINDELLQDKIYLNIPELSEETIFKIKTYKNNFYNDTGHNNHTIFSSNVYKFAKSINIDPMIVMYIVNLDYSNESKSLVNIETYKIIDRIAEFLTVFDYFEKIKNIINSKYISPVILYRYNLLKNKKRLQLIDYLENETKSDIPVEIISEIVNYIF